MLLCISIRILDITFWFLCLNSYIYIVSKKSSFQLDNIEYSHRKKVYVNCMSLSPKICNFHRKVKHRNLESVKTFWGQCNYWPDLIGLLAGRATTISRQPFNGDRKGLWAGDRHVGRCMRSGAFNQKCSSCH